MYSSVVKLALAHEQEIGRAAASLIKENKVPYYETVPMEELAQRTLPSFHLRLRYLESGDLTEWKQYAENLTKEREKQGVNYSSIVKAGEYIAEAMLQFFQREIPKLGEVDGIPSATILRNVERRMQGLTLVGNTTVIRTGISPKSNV